MYVGLDVRIFLPCFWEIFFCIIYAKPIFCHRHITDVKKFFIIWNIFVLNLCFSRGKIVNSWNFKYAGKKILLLMPTKMQN